MITSLAKIISPLTTYPEIVAVHIINITSATLTLICIYLLISKLISPFFAFLLTVLVATNQINVVYSLDVNNEIIYTFFLVLSLLLYHHQKKSLTYLLFGLLFFLRYESIAIPISVFIIEYYSKKPKLKTKNILLTFIPIIFWLIILNFHGKVGASLFDNAYLEEILNGLKRLPNTSAFTALIEIITANGYQLILSSQIFFLITLILSFIGIINTNLKPIIRIAYLIFIFHLLFLFAFPNFSIRYLIPVLWILYLIIANQKSKIISYLIVFCLLTYNIARINIPTEYYHNQDMLEYKLMAKWLNQTQFDKKTIVIVYEPHIIKYYINNPQVDIKFDYETPFETCQENLDCICNFFYSQNSKPNVLVVITTLSEKSLYSASDPFTAKLHHVKTFKWENIGNKPNYQQINYLENGDHYANIFKYNPEKSP